MKINIKRFLLLTAFICICCTGSAYASDVVGLDISFSPQAPFSPGEQVTVTATVSPSQSGAYVELQSDLGGYFASGYTDDNGKFTEVCTVPYDALERGSIVFTAICQPPQNDQWAQSVDYYCNIVSPAPVGFSQSFSPEPPFWPGEHVDVTATIEPIRAGVHVKLQSEVGDYFAEGYTDSNGKFTGVYIVPDDALEFAQHAEYGAIRFTAVCPEANSQSADIPCKIMPKPAEEPQIPEFPSIVVPVVAVLGMVAIVGRRKM